MRASRVDGLARAIKDFERSPYRQKQKVMKAGKHYYLIMQIETMCDHMNPKFCTRTVTLRQLHVADKVKKRRRKK